jgi:two-component system LytT family response regulator
VIDDTPIRTLIVEDETPARQWLRALCNKAPGVHVVGECATAAEASRTLRSTSVDLLLLDIQLGPHTGFQVLDGVPYTRVPRLVFVTAHDQYAVQAFERRAIDYLLKPVLEDRFCETLTRVRRQLRGGVTAHVQTAMREAIGDLERTLLAVQRRHYTERLIAERDEVYWVMDCHRIVTLESEGNYVRVTDVGGGAPALLRGTLQSVGAVLDPETFVRINRSVIVNMTHVERIERDHDSHLVFVMRESGGRFSVGRTFHPHVAQMLKLGAA